MTQEINEGIKKIEIIKKDGQYHINVVKDMCPKEEEITDKVLKRISESLNGNLKKTKFLDLFVDNMLLEQSINEKHAYRNVKP